MKSIVLATDFSSGAKHVAIFAGQLASDQKETLILVHAFQVWPDNPAKTGDFLLPAMNTIESSEKSLHRLANELHEEIGPDIVIHCVAPTKQRAEHIRHLLNPQPHTLIIKSGEKIYDTLLDFAHASKADLIMMLPQMRNWLWRLVAEGETQRMARLTDIPLLAIG